MGKRLRKKRSIQASADGEGDCDAELIEEKGKTRHLSLKDVGVILIMSTLLSIVLVTCTTGVNGLLERLQRNDITDIMLAIFFFMCLFALLSYILVKVAAHYVVYLAIATFCGIIFPVSPRKRQATVRDIYEKAK